MGELTTETPVVNTSDELSLLAAVAAVPARGPRPVRIAEVEEELDDKNLLGEATLAKLGGHQAEDVDLAITTEE